MYGHPALSETMKEAFRIDEWAIHRIDSAIAANGKGIEAHRLAMGIVEDIAQVASQNQFQAVIEHAEKAFF